MTTCATHLGLGHVAHPMESSGGAQVTGAALGNRMHAVNEERKEEGENLSVG